MTNGNNDKRADLIATITTPASAPKPQLDGTDAMLLFIVAVDTFESLDLASLPVDVRNGAALFYDALIRQAKAALPPDIATLEHVHRMIVAAADLVRVIRERYGLPSVQ